MSIACYNDIQIEVIYMAKNYEYEYAEINKEIETIQANILKTQ